MTDALNYGSLKALGEQLNRPVSTLLVQDAGADPFYAELPMRLARAQWFKQVWDRLAIQPGAHLRRIHYRLVSEPVPLPRTIRWKDTDTGEQLETSTYVNNRNCWIFLGDAASDARYCGLIPIEHIADQRNAETVVNYAPHDSPAMIITACTDACLDLGLEIDTQAQAFPYLPNLSVTPPSVAQPYAVELWIEKSTMDDILEPLARRYDINFTSGTGDISLTRCNDLIERALDHGKPTRVLCVTDFDPGGSNMPVAWRANWSSSFASGRSLSTFKCVRSASCRSRCGASGSRATRSRNPTGKRPSSNASSEQAQPSWMRWRRYDRGNYA